MNNTIVRTLSGVVFLGIMITAILLNRYTFIALILLIVILGLLEFYKLTAPKASKLQVGLAIMAGVCLVLSPVAVLNFKLSISIVALLMVGVFIAALYHKAEKPFEHISYLTTGIAYIAFPFSLMVPFTSAHTESYYSGLPLLAYFILLWSNDVGAYCFGITLGKNGKHKLFPRHSPKKSWEGFIGGTVTAMVAGFLVAKYMLGLPTQVTIHFVVIGLIVAVFGTLGDLVESMLKRSVGVKDSGNIMPGHGGILDRFDGVLLSFPIVMWYYGFII